MLTLCCASISIFKIDPAKGATKQRWPNMRGHTKKGLTMWPRGPASLGQVLRWPNLVGHETKVAHEAGPQIQGFDQAAQWPSICWLSYAVHQFIQRLCKHCFTVTLVVIGVPI